MFTSNVALADAFADFRAEAQRKIPSGWVCGEVRTIEGRTLFDISSPKNRFTIIITQHNLISQDEWTLRSKRMKQTVDSILAGKEIKEVESLKNGIDLPDGRFGGTALGIDLSEPELHYPEIGADDLAAKAVVKALLRIIKPYKNSEQAVPPNGP
jgi:hypothetical protein